MAAYMLASIVHLVLVCSPPTARADNGYLLMYPSSDRGILVGTGARCLEDV